MTFLGRNIQYNRQFRIRLFSCHAPFLISFFILPLFVKQFMALPFHCAHFSVSQNPQRFFWPWLMRPNISATSRTIIAFSASVFPSIDFSITDVDYRTTANIAFTRKQINAHLIPPLSFLVATDCYLESPMPTATPDKNSHLSAISISYANLMCKFYI